MQNELAQMMEANLLQVWSERDEVRRMKAIQNIYTDASILYHSGYSVGCKPSKSTVGSCDQYSFYVHFFYFLIVDSLF